MTAETIYAIIGPTAVGKTAVSFELARRTGAEIVSVDSRQVYRYLDIGSDKISHSDRRIVPHHLIDVADPDQVFTASDFVEQARDAVARIRARGRLPILAGGTALYYRAFEGATLSCDLPKDSELRASLDAFAEDNGNEALHARLAAVDRQSAERIHPNDRVRVVRALEIFELTGESASAVYAGRQKMSGGEIVYFGVSSPRQILYERIARRVREQFYGGYPEEVEWLLARGYSPDLPALSGFGYRELVLYLRGEIGFDEALEGDVKATKAFARRQMTWFKQFPVKMWYDLSENSIQQVAGDMERAVNESMEAQDL